MNIFPWGNEPPSCDLAIYKSEEGYGCGVGVAPWAAGSKAQGASPYGALDMAGNVLEWTADRYASSYESGGPVTDPTGPAVGETRAIRGGDFGDDPYELRTSFRDKNREPTYARYYLGFRCCHAAGSD
jgi:formylglycine-generating enzyme required for sulfatase activity